MSSPISPTTTSASGQATYPFPAMAAAAPSDASASDAGSNASGQWTQGSRSDSGSHGKSKSKHSRNTSGVTARSGTFEDVADIDDIRRKDADAGGEFGAERWGERRRITAGTGTENTEGFEGLLDGIGRFSAANVSNGTAPPSPPVVDSLRPTSPDTGKTAVDAAMTYFPPAVGPATPQQQIATMSPATSEFWLSPKSTIGMNPYLPQGFIPTTSSPTPSLAGSSKFTPLKRVRKNKTGAASGSVGGTPGTPAVGIPSTVVATTPAASSTAAETTPTTTAPRKRDSITSGTTEVASHPDADYGIHGKKLATAYTNPTKGNNGGSTNTTPGSSPGRAAAKAKEKIAAAKGGATAELVLLHISLIIPHDKAPAYARHQRRMARREERKRLKAAKAAKAAGEDFEAALTVGSGSVGILDSQFGERVLDDEDDGLEDDSDEGSDFDEDVDAADPGPLSVLSPVVYQRGILIPHPKGDYELLQREVGDILGLPFEDLRVDEEDPSAVAEGRKMSVSQTQNQGRGWTMRVYARNGWLTRGAWERAWAEMERVDVEISEVGVKKESIGGSTKGDKGIRSRRKSKAGSIVSSKAGGALAAPAAATTTNAVSITGATELLDDTPIPPADVSLDAADAPETTSTSHIPPISQTEIYSDPDDEVGMQVNDPTLANAEEKLDDISDIDEDIDLSVPGATITSTPLTRHNSGSDIDDLGGPTQTHDDETAVEAELLMGMNRRPTRPQGKPKPGQLQLENGTVGDGELEEAYRAAMSEGLDEVYEADHNDDEDYDGGIDMQADYDGEYLDEDLVSYADEFEDEDSDIYREQHDGGAPYSGQRTRIRHPHHLHHRGHMPPQLPRSPLRRRAGTRSGKAPSSLTGGMSSGQQKQFPLHPYQYILDLLKPIVLTGLVVSAGMFFFGPTSSQYGYHPYSRTPSTAHHVGGRHGAWSGGIGSAGGRDYIEYDTDDFDDIHHRIKGKVGSNKGRGAGAGGGTPYGDSDDDSMDQDIEFDAADEEVDVVVEGVPDACMGYAREAGLWRKWMSAGKKKKVVAEVSVPPASSLSSSSSSSSSSSTSTETSTSTSSSSATPRQTHRPHHQQHHHHQHHNRNQGSGGDWTVTVTQTVTQRIVNAGATQIVVEIPSGEAQFPLGPLGLVDGGVVTRAREWEKVMETPIVRAKEKEKQAEGKEKEKEATEGVQEGAGTGVEEDAAGTAEEKEKEKVDITESNNGEKKDADDADASANATANASTEEQERGKVEGDAAGDDDKEKGKEDRDDAADGDADGDEESDAKDTAKEEGATSNKWWGLI